MASKRSDKSNKAAFWQQHVARYKASGQTRAEYCRQHGLKFNQLAYQVGLLNKQTGRGQQPFAQVVVSEAPSTPRGTAARLVTASGVAVEFESGADPAWIACLVAAVGGQR